MFSSHFTPSMAAECRLFPMHQSRHPKPKSSWGSRRVASSTLPETLRPFARNPNFAFIFSVKSLLPTATLSVHLPSRANSPRASLSSTHSPRSLRNAWMESMRKSSMSAPQSVIESFTGSDWISAYPPNSPLAWVRYHPGAHHVEIDVCQASYEMVISLHGGRMVAVFPESPLAILP